ncbi:MAG: hypothetical protein IJC59_04370 [Lachnospiraceae bacterium]|nr:hypothetical protein [Lachnospiraceae bacterium]
MIQGREISLEFIKKEAYTGSYQGMRYLLETVTPPAEEGEGREESGQKWEKAIRAVIWPEPYNYGKTPEQRKQQRLFPLSSEGKDAAVEWLNEQYVQQKSLWNTSR